MRAMSKSNACFWKQVRDRHQRRTNNTERMLNTMHLKYLHKSLFRGHFLFADFKAPFFDYSHHGVSFSGWVNDGWGSTICPTALQKWMSQLLTEHAHASGSLVRPRRNDRLQHLISPIGSGSTVLDLNSSSSSLRPQSPTGAPPPGADGPWGNGKPCRPAHSPSSVDGVPVAHDRQRGGLGAHRERLDAHVVVGAVGGAVPLRRRQDAGDGNALLG